VIEIQPALGDLNPRDCEDAPPRLHDAYLRCDKTIEHQATHHLRAKAVSQQKGSLNEQLRKHVAFRCKWPACYLL
jgi:hypothetical protein